MRNASNALLLQVPRAESICHIELNCFSSVGGSMTRWIVIRVGNALGGESDAIRRRVL